MDLAEIFRTHMQELAFTLFIRNVTVNRVNKYFVSFFHACRDLADWIYAGGRAGVNSHSDSPKYIKKNFRFPKYIDSVLRDFKRMIINENFQIGRYITPNKMEQLKNRNKSQNISPEDLIIHDKISENSKETVNNYFTISSIDKFLKNKNTLARLNGDKFHKILLYGLPQPFSLEKVIEQGENYNIFGLPILIVAEITLTDYISTRRPDLMVFARIYDRGWQPIAILDVKTQFDYNCFIRGKRKKNNWDIIQPNVCLKTVELSYENWQYFGNTRLRPREKTQLNELEILVKQAFHKISDTDLSLIIGIIRIAPSTNKNEWNKYQADMLNLIISTFSNLNDSDNDFESDQLVFHNTNSDKKISLVLDKSPTTLDLGMNYNNTKSSSASIQKPQIGTTAFRNNILYLFAKSNTPAGYSTAWIATYSHLIPHVVKKHKNEKIALVDLIGTLSKFTKNRLRTDKSKSLEKSLHKIEIINWDLTTSLDRLTDELPEGFDVYIFAGWESYKSIISHQDLKLVENEIVRKIHGSSTIYWVDEANRGEYTSKLYHQRSISVDKHLPSLRSKIIFNLPIAPKKPSDKNPQYPDYRVIIEWNKNNRKKNYQIKHYLKPTIALRGHTNKFANRKLRSKLSRFSKIHSNKELQEIEISKAYDLVPWLRDNNSEDIDGQGLKEEIETNSDAIEIYEAQYSKYSSIQLKLLNLKFVERDWISRSKRYVDKSQINTKIRINPPIDYSILPKITQAFPIHRNLLTPGYRIDDIERRERKRLLDTIAMLKNTVLNKFKSEEFEDLKSLFKIIKKSIETNKSLQELKKLIIEWELTFTDKLSYIIQDRRIRAYYRHIVYSKTSPSNIKGNVDFFLEIGNSNFLLLLTLFHIYPELTDFQLEKMWDDLLPFTLDMIGFQPKYDNLLKTQFNSKSTWYYLNKRANYLSNRNLDQILYKRRDGFMLQTNRGYTWLYIENYPPILFYSGKYGLLDLVNQGLFYTVNDEDLVSEIIEVSTNLMPNRISVNRYMRDDYIWVHINDNWILVGKLELHTTSTLNSILSFEITEAINYPPKPEDEPYEIDVEEVLGKVEFIIGQDLYLNFSLERDRKIGYIDLDFYLKDDVIASKYQFTKISAIDGVYFSDSHKMIQYLRELNNEKTVTFGDETYRFDPIENTQWMGWLKIKALVQSKVDLTKYVAKRNGLEFIQDYGNLLFVSPDDLEIIYLEISHNIDYCVIQEISMDDVRTKVKRLGSQRKYDMKLYKTIQHQNCFEISVVENLEGFSENARRRFNQKYVGRFSGGEILKLLSPAIQYIEDENGVMTEYLINLELIDEEIIQEDMLIRILLNDYYQTYLKRRPPGSYRLGSDYIVTKIINSPNGNYLELHYQNMITGYNDTKNILGDANSCVANDNFESNLKELQAEWVEDDSMGNLDISESIHYQNWMKICKDHRATCDDSIHEMGTDEFTFVEAKSFELIKEESMYSVILHVERTADTKDTEPLTSYNMNEVDLSDIGGEIKRILENLSHEDFLSSINSEFDLIYPQDKSLINNLHVEFCSLADEVLDEIKEEFGENSENYEELYEILDVAFLNEKNQ